MIAVVAAAVAVLESFVWQRRVPAGQGPWEILEGVMGLDPSVARSEGWGVRKRAERFRHGTTETIASFSKPWKTAKVQG